MITIHDLWTIVGWIIVVPLAALSWWMRHQLSTQWLHPKTSWLVTQPPKDLIRFFGYELIFLLIMMYPCYLMQQELEHFFHKACAFVLSMILADLLLEPCLRYSQHRWMIGQFDKESTFFSNQKNQWS